MKSSIGISPFSLPSIARSMWIMLLALHVCTLVPHYLPDCCSTLQSPPVQQQNNFFLLDRHPRTYPRRGWLVRRPGSITRLPVGDFTASGGSSKLRGLQLSGRHVGSRPPFHGAIPHPRPCLQIYQELRLVGIKRKVYASTN